MIKNFNANRFSRQLAEMFFAVMFLSLLIIPQYAPARADSIWAEDESTSQYTNEKNFKVGDIITILLAENTSAVTNAGTNTNAREDLSFSINHTIDKLANVIGKNTSLTGSAQNKYAGDGSTTRSSKLVSVVSCRVIEILSNGNLKIAGTHSLSINQEEQQILISGVIRSKDVSLDNTIVSSKVAQAQVSVKGKGMVEEAQSPGWITRFFNWIF